MRLIDADALKKALDWIIDNPYVDLDREIMEEIDNAPTVDAYTEDDVKTAIKEGHEVGYEMAEAKFERPQGKWIPQTAYDGFTYWKCSECGKENDFALTKFCFHCGADMRKEAENE